MITLGITARMISLGFDRPSILSRTTVLGLTEITRFATSRQTVFQFLNEN